ncbi:MAG: carboxypeptidase-like regulatory domain-containing protein [Pirellula sp.]
MNTILKYCCSSLVWSAFAILLSGCGGTGIPTASVTGRITINGEPIQGVEVTFVPTAKIRPSVAITDAQGRYKAQFVAQQSGVALGPCVVQFAIYRGGNYMHNYLPAKFNTEAEKNPEFNLDVPKKGLVFDYDIKFVGKIPPYVAE